MPHKPGHVLTPEEELSLQNRKKFLQGMGLVELPDGSLQPIGVSEERPPPVAPIPQPTISPAQDRLGPQSSPFFQSRLSQQPSRKLQGIWEGIAQPIGGAIGFGIQNEAQRIQAGLGAAGSALAFIPRAVQKGLEAAEATTTVAPTPDSPFFQSRLAQQPSRRAEAFAEGIAPIEQLNQELAGLATVGVQETMLRASEQTAERVAAEARARGVDFITAARLGFEAQELPRFAKGAILLATDPLNALPGLGFAPKALKAGSVFAAREAVESEFKRQAIEAGRRKGGKLSRAQGRSQAEAIRRRAALEEASRLGAIPPEAAPVVREAAEEVVPTTLVEPTQPIPVQQAGPSLVNPNAAPIDVPGPQSIVDSPVTPAPAPPRNPYPRSEVTFAIEGQVIDSFGNVIPPSAGPRRTGLSGLPPIQTAETAIIGTTPETLSRMATRQPLPQPVTFAAPNTSGGRMLPEDSEKIIEWFGDFITSPESANATELTKILRSRELAARAERFKELLDEGVESGLGTEAAINRATRALKGGLPYVDTGPILGMVENEVRDALSNRIYRVLSGDAFEIRNTQTALDNALAGKPIPRDPGVKGGSAYSRLVKVFGVHITEGLSKREALDELILRSAKSPRGVGERAVFPEAGLLDNPSQPRLFEFDYNTRQLPKDPTTYAQRELDRQAYNAFFRLEEDVRTIARAGPAEGTGRVAPEVSPPQFGPSQQIGFRQLEDVEPIAARPYQVIGGEVVPLEGAQTPVTPRRSPVDTRSPVERQLDTEELAVRLADEPTPTRTPKIEATDEVAIEQLKFIPRSTREKLLAPMKLLGLNFLDFMNFLRANKASVDLSYLRQQAMLMARNPREFGPSFIDALKATWSDDYARSLDDSLRSIKTNPVWPVYEDAVRRGGGDFLRPLGGEIESQWQAAEEFMALSRIKGDTRFRPFLKAAEHIPWIRISGRAHVTGMNSMNMRIFQKWHKELLNLNDQVAKKTTVLDEYDAIHIPNTMRDLSKLLAEMSGRGPLPEGLKKWSVGINALFFSLRMTIGRFSSHRHLASRNAFVRRKAWENHLTGYALYSSVIMAGRQMGLWDVEVDPRSSDFMKIQLFGGRQTIDVWAGLQPLAVLVGRLSAVIWSEEHVAQTKPIRGQKVGQIIPVDPLSAMGQTLGRNKVSPGIQEMLVQWTEKDFNGDEVDRKNMLDFFRRQSPIAIEEAYEAIDKFGLTGLPAAVLAELGQGVRSHDTPRWPEIDEYYGFGTKFKKAEADRRRTEFRRNPQNEAKLFIRGTITTFREPTSRGIALKMMRDFNLDPADYPGFENADGAPQMPPVEQQVTPQAPGFQLSR